MDTPDSVVIMLGGGINSTVAAAHAVPGVSGHCIYFDHGQPAAQAELRAAQRIAHAIAAKLHVVQLPRLSEIIAIAGQVRPDRRGADPERGRRRAGRRPPGVMLTMFGAALQLARQLHARTVVCGLSQCANDADVQAGQGHGDPEAREAFVHAAATAMKMALSDKRGIDIETPFMDMDRADIVRAGLRIGAPLHLSWSCHESGFRPCRDCPGCASRAAAFDEVGQADPVAQSS